MRLSKATFSIYILPVLAFLILSLFSSSAYSDFSGAVKGLEVAELGENFDFISEPVRYMEQIQMDLHFGKIDRGIARARNAIVLFEERYGNDPYALLDDPMLKLNKAHQVKSILHTFLGMLYYRKSLLVDSHDRSIIYGPVLDKVRRGEEFTDRDLEKVADAVDSNDLIRERIKYHEAARQELRNAIEIDAMNPIPHSQLGKIYSASVVHRTVHPSVVEDQSAEAEKEYFLAAKLLIGEGDRKGTERVVEAIASVNSDSAYIKEIERMLSDR